MFRKVRILFFGSLLTLAVWVPGHAAVWEMTGQIGLIQVYAQMEDTEDPITVLLRVENIAELESFKVSRDFVLMKDSESTQIRPISADEVVSGYLQELRTLMPQHAPEISDILGEIRADFPQEKIVEVYGRLKKYMQIGKPITWRTNLENYLLGKRHSTRADFQAAEKIIEKIGVLSKNYFWPTEIAPDAQYTGIVFFESSFKHPVTIFFQIGKNFIGAPMQIIHGDKKIEK
ncbi:hypothetical protein K8S19_12605 [bacterium]|nr:hypothetical protein [bacterium]